MAMLPVKEAPSLPVLPLSRRHSWNDGPNPMLDSSAVVEMEARNPRTPELDAEAPGPHVLEIEIVEPVLEMYVPRTVVDLEGRNKHAAVV